MFIAMRVFLVLFLTSLGVFAPLAEVNAGRFCRQASCCPCVVASCCPCVEVTPCLPEGFVFAESLPVVAFTNPSVIKGTCYSSVDATLTINAAFTVQVWGVLTSGQAPVLLASKNIPASANGFFQFTSNELGTSAPVDSKFKLIFKLGTNPDVTYGWLSWTAANHNINPLLP